MGCNTSRLDRLPAVALCRDRCKFLDEALRQSYALADAHVTHMESLKTLGPALLCFFDQFEDSGETNEGKPKLSKSPPIHSPSSSSSSNSDVHVLLHSESESEAEDTDKEFQLFTESRYDYLNYDTALPATDNVAFMNYVEPLYAPFSPPKPPPPPPPNSSAWDFLNFFEPYERYLVPYNPSGNTDAKEEKEKEKEKGKTIITQKNDGVGVHGSKSTVGESKVNEEENGEAKNKMENSVSEECSNSNSAKVKSAKGLSEAVKEIQILFERASGSGNPILEMLDVGKLRYHRKIDFNPG